MSFFLFTFFDKAHYACETDSIWRCFILFPCSVVFYLQYIFILFILSNIWSISDFQLLTNTVFLKSLIFISVHFDALLTSTNLGRKLLGMDLGALNFGRYQKTVSNRFFPLSCHQCVKRISLSLYLHQCLLFSIILKIQLF